MPATTVDALDAQTQLMHLLTLALQGGEVVIAKDDVPLVRLVPVAPRKKGRTADLHRGAMRIREDFNDPLPDEFWLGIARAPQGPV